VTVAVPGVARVLHDAQSSRALAIPLAHKVSLIVLRSGRER